MKKNYLLLMLSLVAVIGHYRAGAQLSGTYTINSAAATGGTNFQTFNAAVSALTTQGIAAAVTFNVSTGTYAEQVIIPQIAGTSVAKTITIHGNGATLSYNPTVTTERAILKLNGADHMVVDSLNIIATGSSATEYGYGIQLLNDADSNVVNKCTITTSYGTSQAIALNYAGIVVNSNGSTVVTTGNPNCDGNTFSNNILLGGYYGVALVADGNTSTISGNKVLNNTIQDFYNVGVYLNGNIGTVIEGNDIARPNRPLTPVYQFLGISLSGISTKVIISKNRIHDPFGSNTSASSGAFGTYITNCTATAGNENVISNNVVYNFNSAGITHGFDVNNNSNYNKFIHNTVSLDFAASTAFGTARGISITYTSTNITFVNNIISISKGGAFAGKHCIYVDAGSTGHTINNNDLSMRATGNPAGVGYFGANRITLSDWQTASGYDAASLSIDPAFTSLTNLLPTATALATAGQPTSITTDIANTPRSLTTPSIGAYELPAFCAAPATLAVSGITSTGATATWASNGSNHQVQYGATGFVLGTGLLSGNLTANTYTFSSLNPLTTYEFYVRDSCGPGSLSAWVGPFSFTTLCAIPAAPVAVPVSRCGAGIVTLNATSATSGAVLNWYAAPTSSTSIQTGASYTTSSLSINTLYYVSASSGTCESARTSVAVTINALPVVNLGNDTTICTNASLTLNAGNSGATYAWSTTATTQTIAVSTPGTYSVTVTNTGLCAATDTIVVTTAPLTGVASFTTVPAPTNPRMITFTPVGAQNATAYSWNFGDGNTSTQQAPVHTYTANGTYAVTLTVQGRCKDSTIRQSVTISTNGIAQLNATAIRIYPNPVSDRLYVNLDQAITTGQVRILDAAGRVILSASIKDANADINVSTLAAGIYFLEFKNEHYTGNARFTKY